MAAWCTEKDTKLYEQVLCSQLQNLRVLVRPLSPDLGEINKVENSKKDNAFPCCPQNFG
jgi:hypothetical protein